MMRRYPDLTHHEQAQQLREAAEAHASDPVSDVLEGLAEYLDTTADDLDRKAYQEVAMAYVAGYETGAFTRTATKPEDRRAVWRVMADVGLTR